MSFLSRCTKSSQEDVLEMMSFIDEPRRKVSAESYEPHRKRPKGSERQKAEHKDALSFLCSGRQ